MTPSLVPGRSCGTCTLCCRLPEIEEFGKDADEWCSNCVAGKGCTIYSARPKLCRDFYCRWMIDETLGPEWEPAVSHMMVYGQGAQITILADPDHPALWKSEPYRSALREWSHRAASAGGYLVSFWRNEVTKI